MGLSLEIILVINQPFKSFLIKNSLVPASEKFIFADFLVFYDGEFPLIFGFR